MSIGIIGSVGKPSDKITYNDYQVTLAAQTGGVDNWLPYSTAGEGCYVYDLSFTDLPAAGLTQNSDVTVLPRGTITKQMLEKFGQINAVEVTQDDNQVDCVRFYSMNGKPTDDILVTLRVLNK